MDGTGFSGIDRQDRAAIHAAIHHLARTAPQFSARTRVTAAQAVWVMGGVAVLIAALAVALGAVVVVVRVFLTGAFVTLIGIRIAATTLAATSPPAMDRAAFPDRATPRADDILPIYSVLCPLYREPSVAKQLLEALGRIDYPPEKLDVKLIVEEDDPATRDALHAAGLPNWAQVIVTPAEGPRTKPKALNYALAFAHGDYVCVFDAEDDPHPRQLRDALGAFEAGPAHLGCVQAPLTIANGAQSWIAAQFAAEYAIQFGQALPFYAHGAAPFALGGTSNHFRRAALRDAGGWDPYNVTEDADLGFRLARCGWEMTTIATPTIESAPIALGAWLRQRTRWIKGYLQTWLVLMRDPVQAALRMGLPGFLAMQAQLGGALVSAFAHGPLAVALLVAAVSPDIAVDAAAWALAAAGYASAAYGALVAALTARDPALLRATLTMPLYWPLVSIAAVRALIELIVAPHYWAKTDHTPRAPVDALAPPVPHPPDREPRDAARADA